MSTRFRILLVIVLMCSEVVAQKSKTVTATYTYYAPETMSLEEAKRTALNRAKIQAIADEFGTIVTQNTSTSVSNTNGETDTHFFSVGGSDVKGEWIETVQDPKYEIVYSDGFLIIGVELKGKIREITRADISIDARILRNGTEMRDESDSFLSGDDLYLYFKSPISGFLLVYLVDYSTNNAYCLLPYSNSGEVSQEVEMDRPYIFFHQETSEYPTLIDEYVMTCGNNTNLEYNEVVVIFSPQKLIKGNSEQIDSNLPRQIQISEFEKWKSQILRDSKETQFIIKPLTIKKH